MLNTIIGWLLFILAIITLVTDFDNEVTQAVTFYGNLILANLYFIIPNKQ